MVDQVVAVYGLLVHTVACAIAGDHINLNASNLPGWRALQAKFFKLQLDIFFIRLLLQIVRTIRWPYKTKTRTCGIGEPLVKAGEFGSDGTGTCSQKCRYQQPCRDKPERAFV